jgi:DNA ligase (NAD+)
MAQRSALDIEGLGGVVAEKLVESGLAKEPLGPFDLKLDQLASLNLGTSQEPRVLGEKNAAKVIEALERAKTLPLGRWLHALGIPNVGEVTAHEIAKFHKKLAELEDSQVLKDVLELEVKLAEVDRVNPDATKEENQPPIKRARLAKAKEDAELSKRLQEHPAQSQIDEIEAQRLRLKSEIEDLRRQEPEERKDRIRQTEQLNKRIESLVASLREVGVNVKVEKPPKKGRKDGLTAPPTISVTTEIAPEAARGILAFFSSHAGKKMLRRLKELGISPKGEKSVPPGKSMAQSLAERTFVFTGTLKAMARDEAAEEVRKRGGSVTNSVSKNTSFLVVGEDAGATKSDQARTLGVPMLNEKEFVEMLGSAKEAKPETKQGELFRE